MKNNLINVHPSVCPLVHLLILLILTSCITTKQLHQGKTNITTESSTKETIVNNSQIISNTRVTESQDTSVLLKGSELFSSAKFNSLLSGDTIFASDANMILKTFYDSLSKTIKTQATISPKTVLFKYQKITLKQVLETGTITSTKLVQQKQSIQSVNKDKDIARSSLPWWLIVIIFVIVSATIGWVFLKLKH
jgi:hypothetical protein